MPAKPILVYQLIKSGHSLPTFLQQTASEQCRLLKIVRQILPQALAELVAGCVLKNAELVILTESAASASQLRFYGPDIRDTLNAKSPSRIESVKLRVIQPLKIGTSPRPTQKIPSLKSIQMLRECARFSADADLRRSLIILADTLERQHLLDRGVQSKAERSIS
jgi:hypothetical protein